MTDFDAQRERDIEAMIDVEERKSYGPGDLMFVISLDAVRDLCLTREKAARVDEVRQFEEWAESYPGASRVMHYTRDRRSELITEEESCED